MRLGIVGSEAAKFTLVSEEQARAVIRGLFEQYDPEAIISGACHLGGIDIFAVEEARQAGIIPIEYPPLKRIWSGYGGYQWRNTLIAEDSTHVVCITVKTLPDTYTGMRFTYCYHCKTNAHIKSGGCWTVKKAIELGKTGEVIVV